MLFLGQDQSSFQNSVNFNFLLESLNRGLTMRYRRSRKASRLLVRKPNLYRNALFNAVEILSIAVLSKEIA